MRNGLNGIQGKISNQILVDDIKDMTDIFTGYGMNIIIASKGMNLPSGQHVHDTYEFIIPVSNDFSAAVGKNKMTVDKNSLLPLNPGQYHGPEYEMEAFRFLCVEIEKDYLQDITHSIYGKQEISFETCHTELQNEWMIPIQAFINENKYRQIGYEFVIKGLQYQIAVHLIRHVRNNMNNHTKTVEPIDKRRLNRAVEYMQENCTDEVSLEAIAKIADFSKYHFIKVFKAHTGKTPNEYLISLRIDRAKELILQNKESITNICYLCGFNNLSHFADSFKKRVGVTPSEFRECILVK